MEVPHKNKNSFINLHVVRGKLEQNKVNEEKPAKAGNVILSNEKLVTTGNPVSFVVDDKTKGSDILTRPVVNGSQAHVRNQPTSKPTLLTYSPIPAQKTPTNIIYIRSSFPQSTPVKPVVIQNGTPSLQHPQQGVQVKQYIQQNGTPSQKDVQTKPSVTLNSNSLKYSHPITQVELCVPQNDKSVFQHPQQTVKPCISQNGAFLFQRPQHVVQVSPCFIPNGVPSTNQQVQNQSTSTHSQPYFVTTTLPKQQNILEEMKRQIAQHFVKTYTSSPQEEPKSALLPGTDCEYRTPGAHYLNKNGRIKRPMNAFMVWARDIRGKLAAAMPNATNSDISVKLGQLWANLPEAQKRQYYKTAEGIKLKHRQDFPDWVYKPTPSNRKKDNTQPFCQSLFPKQYSSMSAETERAVDSLKRETFSPQTSVSIINATCQSTESPSISTPVYIQSTESCRNITIKPGLSDITRDMLATKISTNRTGINTCAAKELDQSFNTSSNQGFPTLRPLLKSTFSEGSTYLGQLLMEPENKQVPVSVLLRSPLDMLKTVPILETHITAASNMAVPVAYNGVPICTFTRQLSETQTPLTANHDTTTSASNSKVSVNEGMSSEKPTNKLASNSYNVDTLNGPVDSGVTTNTSAYDDNDTSSTINSASETSTSLYDNTGWEQTIGSLDENTDDLWPFPFPEEPSESWEEVREKGAVPMYMELLDQYDPFLSCDYLYSELYPGCLHLDIGRWKSYLADNSEDGQTDPLSCFYNSEADDIPVSPVPLQETLARMIETEYAKIKASDFFNRDSVNRTDETTGKTGHGDVAEDINFLIDTILNNVVKTSELISESINLPNTESTDNGHNTLICLPITKKHALNSLLDNNPVDRGRLTGAGTDDAAADIPREEHGNSEIQTVVHKIPNPTKQQSKGYYTAELLVCNSENTAADEQGEIDHTTQNKDIKDDRNYIQIHENNDGKSILETILNSDDKATKPNMYGDFAETVDQKQKNYISSNMNLTKVLAMTYNLMVKPSVTRSTSCIDRSSDNSTADDRKIVPSSPCKRQRSSTSLVESNSTRRRLE